MSLNRYRTIPTRWCTAVGRTLACGRTSCLEVTTCQRTSRYRATCSFRRAIRTTERSALGRESRRPYYATTESGHIERAGRAVRNLLPADASIAESARREDISDSREPPHKWRCRHLQCNQCQYDPRRRFIEHHHDRPQRQNRPTVRPSNVDPAAPHFQGRNAVHVLKNRGQTGHSPVFSFQKTGECPVWPRFNSLKAGTAHPRPPGRTFPFRRRGEFLRGPTASPTRRDMHA